MNNELRRATRYHVKWRAAFITDSGAVATTYFGHITNISVTGVLLLTEKAIPILPLAELHIEMPSRNNAESPVLTIKVHIVYQVYDGVKHVFRNGIEFVEYVQNSDKGYLESYLSKNHHEVI